MRTNQPEMEEYVVLTHRPENAIVDTVAFSGPRARNRAVEFATRRPKAVILDAMALGCLDEMIAALNNQVMVTLLQQVRFNDSTTVTPTPSEIAAAFKTACKMLGDAQEKMVRL